MKNPMKRCPKCGNVKARTEFSPGNNKCKRCKSIQLTERYWADAEYREKRKAYHRENERRKRADPERNALILAKLRAKRANDPEWRARTLAAVNARARKFPGRNLAIQARKRAKERGTPCTITASWAQALWEAEPNCVYCGRLVRSAPGRHADDSATLDRLVCSDGYTTANTVIACWRCNTLKRDSTPEELERLAANIRRVQRERRRP